MVFSINIIKEKHSFTFKEDNEIQIKLHENGTNGDAMFLGRCIIHDVSQKKFVGSIGGLKFKLINLSDEIRLFPKNLEINIELYKV